MPVSAAELRRPDTSSDILATTVSFTVQCIALQPLLAVRLSTLLAMQLKLATPVMSE